MTYTHPEYLVSTDWLENHLDDPAVRILDVTAKLSSKLDNGAGKQCYGEAHIPGSIFFDVPSAKGVLSQNDAELPWMWPSPAQFEATMSEFGLSADSRVVLVARTPRPGVDSGTMWCTRAWWTMHHFGVECSILHGGIERWEAEGRPMTSDASAPPATAAPVILNSEWEQARATSADVLAAVGAIADQAGQVCLVDALAPESYDGTQGAYGSRPGHITGAVNVPFRSLIDAETCGFVDPDKMVDVLTGAGLLDAPEVITYCGGAIAATVDAFCLALLGHEHVSVYDGSLMEWTANPDLPITNPNA
jgi:thiosulfate/3-mercaptopyruvate sulfurtransferase